MRGFTYALREDLLGRPIRITTVDPGLVETEFSRVRFRGDEEKATTVYEGVDGRCSAEDVADCVLFAVTRPPHVNVDELVVKALAQSSGAPHTSEARADGRDSSRSSKARPSASATRSATSAATGDGLFAEDTRFLSRFRLTINGQRPLLLSSGKVEYFSAAFFLRNPLAGGLQQDVLSIARERFVGDGHAGRVSPSQNQGDGAGRVRARARGRDATSRTSSP